MIYATYQLIGCTILSQSVHEFLFETSFVFDLFRRSGSHSDCEPPCECAYSLDAEAFVGFVRDSFYVVCYFEYYCLLFLCFGYCLACVFQWKSSACRVFSKQFPCGSLKVFPFMFAYHLGHCVCVKTRMRMRLYTSLLSLQFCLPAFLRANGSIYIWCWRFFN